MINDSSNIKGHCLSSQQRPPSTVVNLLVLLQVCCEVKMPNFNEASGIIVLVLEV